MTDSNTPLSQAATIVASVVANAASAIVAAEPKFVSIGAQLTIQYINKNTTPFSNWMHGNFEAVMTTLPQIVDANFPTNTLEERVVHGPIVKLLTNVGPDTVKALDSGLAYVISSGVGYLKTLV